MSPHPQQAQGDKLYEQGSTTVMAYARDPRFSYCLYVPPGAGAGTEIVVAMHGTGRAFVAYRDAFAPFGRWNDCIVLCPLFPAGVRGDGNRNGFKYLAEGDIRYDQVLLGMVQEVAARYRCGGEQFALFGYSGGGHFAHRFLMLHARRLWAASIGAPGSVTLLDDRRDWWVGTRNVEAVFGVPVDVAAMRQVPVQMVVGKADLETWEITHHEGGPHWMPGANDAGRTRPERLRRLRDSYAAAGVEVRFDEIANMAHDGQRCVPVVHDFLAETLRRRRAAQASQQ